MADDPEDNQNDPIDDELDAAMMSAADLVIRAKTIGLNKLELPIKDESSEWTVTVKRAGTSEYERPGVDGHGANGGQRDGKMP
jgi:hypothetical protein